MTREQLVELLDPELQPLHRAEVVDLAIECLAALVVRVRHVQTLYFETKDRGLLLQAKRLERRLDAITEHVLTLSTMIGERTLFVEANDHLLDKAVAAILASGRPSSTPRAAG